MYDHIMWKSLELSFLSKDELGPMPGYELDIVGIALLVLLTLSTLSYSDNNEIFEIIFVGPHFSLFFFAVGECNGALDLDDVSAP